MRIRQVKPEFWRDATLGDLSDTDRLVYIGLWMEADDTGWFRWNIVEIATDLYPMQPRQARERKVSASLDRLHLAGRITKEPCGHGMVPKLTQHQRLASPEKQVRTVQREHNGCVPAGSRGSPQVPADSLQTPDTERNGKGREGMEGEGGVPGGLTALRPSIQGMTTKKNPDDEDLLDKYLRAWAESSTPDKRSLYQTQLAVMGVKDPAAELARRAA